MNRSKKISLIAAGVLYSASSVSQLLGVIPEQPLFTYNAGGTTSFDASNGSLEINATPLDYLATSGGPTVTIFPITIAPNVSIKASLDSNCDLVSGDTGDDLVISGDLDTNNDFIPEISGTLLTGEITELGIGASPTPAFLLIDAKFAVSGGALETSGDYTSGQELGVTLEVANNDFAGDCLANWTGGAKGSVGALPEVVDPEKCFDVKKLWFLDAPAYQACYGWGSGSSRSKFKVKLAAECENNFDPTNDLIQLELDGETVTFPPGAFEQSISNPAKFSAMLTGRPSVSAVLDCEAGLFSLIASRADLSQVTFNDGEIDVTLTLGTWVKSMTTPINPGYTYGSYVLTWDYWNPNPADCSNPDYEPPACVTRWESVKFKHIESGNFFHFDGGIDSEILLEDNYTDNSGAACSATATVDSSCTTTATCGDIIGGFKIMKIEHQNDSLSCDITTHHGRYHDRWSWKRRKHGGHGNRW